MKLNTVIATLSLAAIFLAFTPVSKLEKISLDTKASKIEWFAEKVTGKHNGIVPLKSGTLETKDGKLTGGSFIVNMPALEVTDLDGGMKEKLEGHLKSADFFGVDKFPEAKLVIKKVEYTDSKSGFNTKIMGDLTIKDKTNPISFPAMVKMEGRSVAAYGELTIDRSKYDVRYGSSSFFDNLGDKAIYDEFTLKVSLGAKS